VKKSRLLGLPFTTARLRLQRDIVFELAKRCQMDDCFRCGKKIERVEDMTIEHKTAWMSAPDPVATFFDLENIAFSHSLCNTKVALDARRKYASPKERRRAKEDRHREANVIRRRAWRQSKRDAGLPYT
jgi:hypothetical protein